MKSILIIIGIILALIVGFFAYFGMFSKVICSVETQGGEILVYKQMTGDYSKSNKLMDETYYALLNKYGIETYKGF